MSVAPNPRRPHPFQTSDSRFEVEVRGDRFCVVERWWFINRNREEEDGEALHGLCATQTEALRLLMSLDR